jgi:subtilase family serine protease
MNASSFQYVFPSGVRPTVDAAWAGEAALDLQWAHAIAPAAKLILVEADTSLTADLYRAVSKAVDVLQPTGGVVTMSFGSDESFFDTTLADTFKTKKTGNISFVTSAGDIGGEISAPGVDPEVLSVGGTFLTVDADGNRIDESAWIDGGGGTSRVFELPEYQKNLIVEGDDVGDRRVVPDVAYTADPASGVAIFSTTPDENGNTGWNAVGGTSVGVPQWAGIAALANQKRGANKLPILGNGQLNNYVYGIARKFNAETFNDITTGDNTLHPATEGFDRATGWGTPRATNLIERLAVANSDNLVSARTKVPFKWRAKFAKDLLQGLNNNAVTSFNGRGTARVRPLDVDFVMDQGGPQFDPVSGELLPAPLDQIDFFATGFERNGNTIVGRGSANVVIQDGYVATFALKFLGRLYRINGQDKITGSFFAISHRGRKLQVGGNPILEGEFTSSGSAF